MLERPAAFVPNPDNAMDTGYFCDKSDDEGVVQEEWSCGESSESVDSNATFEQWDDSPEVLSSLLSLVWLGSPWPPRELRAAPLTLPRMGDHEPR